ncbi:MAG: YhbY family RNA-binding protein [Desulfobacteraceae bacterium]|nr:YhbY family RNA-binding protein [Desulfobacteraceae bacterium]
MNELKGFQKQYLKGLAHRLKPVVFIGQKGISDLLMDAIDAALITHELIKIKFIEFKEKGQKLDICQILEKKSGGALVGMVGHVATFYRPHPEAKKRKIRLPER